MLTAQGLWGNCFMKKPKVENLLALSFKYQQKFGNKEVRAIILTRQLGQGHEPDSETTNTKTKNILQFLICKKNLKHRKKRLLTETLQYIIYLVELEGESSATGKKSKPTSPLKLETTMVSTMLSHISVSLLYLSRGNNDPS